MKSEHRILVAEDDPINVEILLEMLDNKYQLQVARNGAEAIEIADRFMPDMILLDIMMPPGIDGYEVCRRIRANSRHKFVKILLVSAKTMKEERLEGYDAGADDYITKPFAEEELEAKIRVYLRLKHAEEVEKIRSEALARLESVIQNTPMIAIKAFDRKGIIRLWNSVCEKVYEINAQEAIGLHFTKLPLSETSLTALEQNFHRVSETGISPPVHIFEFQTPMKNIRKLYSSMFPVFESGNVNEVFSMDVDITSLWESAASKTLHSAFSGSRNIAR